MNPALTTRIAKWMLENGGTAKVSDLVDAFAGTSRGTVEMAVYRMLKSNTVKRIGPGRYQLTWGAGQPENRQLVMLLALQPEYPQHAKLHATSQHDWAIREFCAFLAKNGVIEWGWDDYNALLLKFRHVDQQAYEAEALHMRSRYNWLYEQYRNGEQDRPTQELKPLPPEVVKRLETPVSSAEAALLAKIRGGRRVGGDDQA